MEYECKGLACLIRHCEFEHGIHRINGPSYDEMVFSGSSGWLYITRLVHRFPFPVSFVEYSMTKVPDERSVGKDLEFLCRIYRWNMTDVEE